MAEYNQSLDSKNCNTILEAGNNLWCHNIAGHPCDKDVSNRLVKNQFDWHARICTGEHRGKGFLLIHGALFQDGQVVFNRGQLICGETLVSREQFLQGRSGSQIGLGAELFRNSELDSSLRCDSDYCT